MRNSHKCRARGRGRWWPRGGGHSLITGLLVTSVTVVGVAETTPTAGTSNEQPVPEGDGTALHLGARLFGQNNGSGLELDGRYGFRSGVQLGLLGSLGYAPHGYMSGQPIDDAVLSRGALVLVVPTTTAGPLQLFLRLVHGATVLSAESADAVRQTNEVGAFAHLSLGRESLLRLGVVLGADLEVWPTVELADQYQGLTGGYGYALSRAVLVYGEGAVGSTFGFNGDNGKVYYGGSLGVRLPFGKEDARGAF